VTITRVRPIRTDPPRPGGDEYRAVLHVHTERSASWSYPPLRRFEIPDCYVPFRDRVRQCDAAGIDLLAITDHDVPFVMDESDQRELESLLSRRSGRLQVLSGEEVTVKAGAAGRDADGAGAHVLILYRGLDPYRDRAAILSAHRQIHRHNHDVFDFFRFLSERDDLVGILAHPFAGPLRLGGETLHRLLSEGLIERIEAYNGGEVTRDQNHYAAAVAEVYGLGVVSSDDEHRSWGRLRNYTYSAAPNREGFLDDLVAGRTRGTNHHSPTYLRKYLELVGGFYLGYLPWLARSMTGIARRRGIRLLTSQIAVSSLLAAVWVPASLAGMIGYLRRGAIRSRRDFSELARIEPRLSDVLFARRRQRPGADSRLTAAPDRGTPPADR
jgi:predicted metal-dependent phosphoesterase TrpH